MDEDQLDQLRQARVTLLRQLIDEALKVEPLGGDLFTTIKADRVFDRVYGGQILAQALMAAAATAPAGRKPHSAHAYYLKLGDPAHPIRYRVERLGDTRAFSNRLVHAEQNDACLAAMMFSFGDKHAGLSHQRPAPATPAPETTTSRDAALLQAFHEALPQNAGVPWALDLRYVDHQPWEKPWREPSNRLWMRADIKLPDDPLLHACLLLYASDFAMAEPIVGTHPLPWTDLITARGVFGASLDHAFWLHGDVRVDDWLLHVQESNYAGDGRGFATGRYYDRSGRLVASVAQEIFVRFATGGATR